MHLRDFVPSVVAAVRRQDFIVILETTPGKAVFEATVRVSRNGSAMNHELLGSISRINEFWEHSQCIHNAELKKYCHCAKGAPPARPAQPGQAAAAAAAPAKPQPSVARAPARAKGG